MKKESGYTKEFTNWVNSTDKITQLASAKGVISSLLVSNILYLAIIFISGIIASVFIKNNLKTEPLVLLSKTEE